MGMSISLTTAAQALLAQQLALDTASHNVANASTAGYSRQRAKLHAIPGAWVPDGLPHPGMGVEVVDIARVRDLFADFQLRGQFSAGAEYDAEARALTSIENILAEPGSAGFRASLDQFFNAWRDLSNNPESGPARIAVLQAGQALTVTANRIGVALVQQRADANRRVEASIVEINGLTAEIASLNEQIVPLKLSGTSTGDLEDRRDLAIDRLSQLMNITYVHTDNGNVEISAGGHPLVSRNLAFALEGVPNAANSNYLDVRFAADAAPLNAARGELRADLDIRDSYVPARIAELDTLVTRIISDVNATHAAGFGLDGVTGRNFFTGATAATMGVDAAVAGSPNAVAASLTAAGVPGDAGNALALADLQYARVLAGGTQTFNDYYGSIVAGIGVGLREATNRSGAQALVIEQLTAQRESASGVNLDEEMISIVQYQRAYQAASKLVAVVDEMLDTLINRTI
jgi:flagellar hook-associated protein 1 FlgK